MDMTEKEAFRLGFVTRCAEEGLTGEQLAARIKSAAEKKALIEYALPAAAVLGGAALMGPSTSAGVALGLPAAVGLGLGSGLGYGAAKVTEPPISDEDIKAQELADTYRLYAAKARANRKAHKYRVHRTI